MILPVVVLDYKRRASFVAPDQLARRSAYPLRHQPGRRLAYANRSAATFSGGAIVCDNGYRGGPQNIGLQPVSSALSVHFTVSGGVDFVLTIVA